jgi:uncharacterized protein YwqG
LACQPDLSHRLGGYPDNIQGSMSEQAQLLSNGVPWPDGLRKARGKRLSPGALDWELLLQIDSDRGAGMMWSDAGRIYLLIHGDDLRERRFEKVWAILQCY